MTEEKKHRVLVVDDHPVVRDGIVRLVEAGGSMCVCGETGDGHEVMRLITETGPDIVILDLTLESGDGMALIGNIKSRYPALPVLVLSMHDESTHALRCIQAGARGYIMKKRASMEIVKAIGQIRSGGIYASDTVKLQLLGSYAGLNGAPQGVDALSPREFQIFRLYGQGLLTAQIADKLQCSSKTVETHCLRIRRKMAFSNINELVASAGAYLRSASRSH